MTCSKGLAFLCVYSTHKELGNLYGLHSFQNIVMKNGVNITHVLIWGSAASGSVSNIFCHLSCLYILIPHIEICTSVLNADL